MIDFSAKIKGGYGRPAALDFGKIFAQECHRLAALMRMTIDRQGEPPGSFPKLSKKTVLGRQHMRKGGKGGMLKRARKVVGTKALIASGTMRNSIDVVDTPRGAFVGIPRKAKASGGKKPYELALIHEYGKEIKYTITREKHLKMLRYMHAVLVPMWRKGGAERGKGKSDLRIGGTMHIVIPARPFMTPAFEAWAENVPHALAEHLIARGYTPR